MELEWREEGSKEKEMEVWVSRKGRGDKQMGSGKWEGEGLWCRKMPLGTVLPFQCNFRKGM